MKKLSPEEGRLLNYMAIDKEGKFIAVASPKMPLKDLAKELAKWVRMGLPFVPSHFTPLSRAKAVKPHVVPLTGRFMRRGKSRAKPGGKE